MKESVRIKRLRSDLRAMEQLRAESSIVDFEAHGDPPNRYRVIFWGTGLCRPEGASQVQKLERHEVIIDLNAAYPRMIPDLTWRTPIFHPNISASGIVCLGGYSTHWAPSLTLDELCVMLWDMIRFHNFDVESPYNREAAIWARDQIGVFPTDRRPLRNRLGNRSREALPRLDAGTAPARPPQRHLQEVSSADVAAEPDTPEVLFIDPEVVEAEVLADDDADIIFIDD